MPFTSSVVADQITLNIQHKYYCEGKYWPPFNFALVPHEVCGPTAVFVLPCHLEAQELPEYHLALDVPTKRADPLGTCMILQTFTAQRTRLEITVLSTSSPPTFSPSLPCLACSPMIPSTP